jgi:hypothetical protein
MLPLGLKHATIKPKSIVGLLGKKKIGAKPTCLSSCKHCGLEFRAICILAICISLWLGVPSYLYFDVAWSSELFVLRCGLDFPSYLYFAVAWSSELF